MEDKPHIVLVVDDDAVCREDIHRQIEDAYTLIDAVTGREALEMAESNPVHCVLLDYRLPDLDGLLVLPNLAETGVPVVMMTAEGSEQIAVEAMRQGAYDYLVKNTFTKDSLRTAIARAIEHATLERKVCEQQRELEMFATTASHDLRAPLRTIGGFVRSIKKDIESSNTERLLEHCQRVSDAVDRMNRLIDGLLEYARLGRGDRPFAMVALNEVAQEVVSSLESTISDLAAQVEIEDLPEVQGDRLALYQLLQNLVANGLKFHNNRGTPSVRVCASRFDDSWRISVGDNGIGIDPQHADQIFQPFRRLHNQKEYEGCGLGLATCKRIIDQHGGRIWVESRIDQGTTFHFTIPVVNSTATAQDDLPSSHARTGFK